MLRLIHRLLLRVWLRLRQPTRPQWPTPLRPLFEPAAGCYLLPAARRCTLRMRPRPAAHLLPPVAFPLLPLPFLLLRVLRQLPKHSTLLSLQVTRNPQLAARTPSSVLHALHLLLLKRQTLRPLTRERSRYLRVRQTLRR